MNNWVQALCLVVACYATYLFTDSNWEAKWSNHMLQDKTDQLAYEKRQRDLTDRYKADVETLQLDLQARNDLLSASIADGRERVGRLHEQLESTKSDLQRASKAAELAGVNNGAAKAALVLSDLYGASVSELQRVAASADDWYNRLEGCNRFYQQVKEAPR